MAISKEDVKYIAKLAKLKFNEDTVDNANPSKCSHIPTIRIFG